jgi:phage terminase large subunit-like protein
MVTLDRRTERHAELAEIFRANPLERYNNPLLPKVHKKQLAFHGTQAPPLGIKALIAANRSGKTVTCVVDDIIQLIDDSLVPDHLKAFKKWHGPVTIWIGAPKGGTHEANSIPLFRKFLPKASLKEGSFSKSFRKQPTPILTLANGSMVVFKTYDQDLDAWASAEVHRIHWDEEPNVSNSRELRSEARARLVSTNGDEIIGMTPLLGFSWVHDDVLQRKDVDPDISVFHMRMEDNPWNTPEAIAKYAEGLTEEEKRMRLNGEFVSLGGLFFDEFREDLHVVEAIEKPPDNELADRLRGQEVVVSIDPGRQRSGVTWTAFDKDNSALVFDEFFPKLAEVVQVADEIKRRNKEWGIRDATYVIDPSSRNKSAINADDVEAAYARQEIYCQRGQNSRPAGILELKRRLQAKPEPTIFFARDCTETITQFIRYARDPKSHDEWAALPQTERVRFDLVDTVRYAVMSRTWFGPEEAAPERTAFQPNFQPAYAGETFKRDPAPFGDWS